MFYGFLEVVRNPRSLWYTTSKAKALMMSGLLSSDQLGRDGTAFAVHYLGVQGVATQRKRSIAAAGESLLTFR